MSSNDRASLPVALLPKAADADGAGSYRIAIQQIQPQAGAGAMWKAGARLSRNLSAATKVIHS